ncbi:ATP-dependent DNA helicase PIF1, partial [Phenoliferia sp. Uapishka_3]
MGHIRWPENKRPCPPSPPLPASTSSLKRQRPLEPLPPASSDSLTWPSSTPYFSGGSPRPRLRPTPSTSTTTKLHRALSQSHVASLVLQPSDRRSVELEADLGFRNTLLSSDDDEMKCDETVADANVDDTVDGCSTDEGGGLSPSVTESEGDDKLNMSKMWSTSVQSVPVTPGSSTCSIASPPFRRTDEEIAANRQAALDKRAIRDAEAARRGIEARDARRRRIAERELKAYGFVDTLPTEIPGLSYHSRGGGGTAESGVVEWAPDPQCSAEQLAVLEQVKAGGNVFFTGSAGVGKSFLLREIKRLLDNLHRPYQVTAPTGIAALNVGGLTLHKWAGLGLAGDTLCALLAKITQGHYLDPDESIGKTSKNELRDRWIQTQTLVGKDHPTYMAPNLLTNAYDLLLVVDEISMVQPDFFTKLNLIAKVIRANTRAFGNPIQKEISSKLSTLAPDSMPSPLDPSPVIRCDNTVKAGKTSPGCGLETRRRRFVFESDTWSECEFKVMELTKVFRQDDAVFVSMLERFRRGTSQPSDMKTIASAGSGLKTLGSIKPTILSATKASVDSENTLQFAKLQDPAWVFSAIDGSTGEWGKRVMIERLRPVPAPKKIELKVGAQVMLLANVDPSLGLVNGSRGVVIDWVHPEQDPTKKARFKDAKGHPIPPERWRLDRRSEFLEVQDTADRIPLVMRNRTAYCKDPVSMGNHTADPPFLKWNVDISQEGDSVYRTQLPLALAWALTIKLFLVPQSAIGHLLERIDSGQGASLDAVQVDTTGVFETGQAYVALSRCRTLEGMRVVGFKSEHLMVDPSVKELYRRIQSKLPFLDPAPPPVNPLDFYPNTKVPLPAFLVNIFTPGPPSRGPPLTPRASTSTSTSTATSTMIPAQTPSTSGLTQSSPAARVPRQPYEGPPLPSQPLAPGPFAFLPPSIESFESHLRLAVLAFKSKFRGQNDVFETLAHELLVRVDSHDGTKAGNGNGGACTGIYGSEQ